MSREISKFPFNRKNAETIKTLGQKAVSAQADLIAFMKQIGSDETKDRIHLTFECSAVENELALDGLLQKNFPELMPVDWGFSK